MPELLRVTQEDLKPAYLTPELTLLTFYQPSKGSSKRTSRSTNKPSLLWKLSLLLLPTLHGSSRHFRSGHTLLKRDNSLGPVPIPEGQLMSGRPMGTLPGWRGGARWLVRPRAALETTWQSACPPGSPNDCVRESCPPIWNLALDGTVYFGCVRAILCLGCVGDSCSASPNCIDFLGLP